MISNDSCIQCLAALVAACGYKVIVKVVARKMIYCIFSTKKNKGELVGSFYGGRKI